MKKLSTLMKEREERFLTYIKNGWTIDDIMDREGMDRRVAIELRKKVASDAGLQISGSTGNDQAYGLTTESHNLLTNLANRLYDLKLKRHSLEVSYLLGLTAAQQRAVERKHHNWTLSQLQRFAKVEGQSFDEFMQKNMARPQKIGFD